MKYSSPYTLTADTPINILEDIGERQHDELTIRFISDVEGAYLLIRLNHTVSEEKAEVVLYSAEAYEIPAERITNTRPVVSVMSNTTGSQIFW